MLRILKSEISGLITFLTKLSNEIDTCGLRYFLKNLERQIFLYTQNWSKFKDTNLSKRTYHSALTSSRKIKPKLCDVLYTLCFQFFATLPTYIRIRTKSLCRHQFSHTQTHSYMHMPQEVCASPHLTSRVLCNHNEQRKFSV